MKISRKEAREALEQIPAKALFGQGPAKTLTTKQKNFARKVAEGATKAQAYRDAYKDNPAPSTITTAPYELARDPRISREIEAYALAIEAAKHRTPAHLRDLVIQSLVQVIIDPDSKDATRVQAAKVLGTVTEVAAFTERKEVRTIKSSEETKAHVLEQLKTIMRSEAEDVTDITASADSLMAELLGDDGISGQDNTDDESTGVINYSDDYDEDGDDDDAAGVISYSDEQEDEQEDGQEPGSGVIKYTRQNEKGLENDPDGDPPTRHPHE